MKSIIKHVAIIVATFVVVYLVLINTALNLTLTQDLINKIKPDKFAVRWDSAWTFYPFRVQLKGVSANGQSAGQQWQFSLSEASASISLVPLASRIVSLRRIDALDVQYRQRPRPRSDKDFSSIREYFPPIQDRELEIRPVQRSPVKKGRKSWDIQIEDIRVSGSHNVWLYQVQAALKGDFQGDLSVQTRGGPISLSNGEVDVNLDSLVLNGDREVSREGRIQGNVELLPFVLKRNKGLEFLNFLTVDAMISSETESLAFLNPYLDAFQGMTVDGAGKLQGRVRLEQGQLHAGSDLTVSAHELDLAMLGYRVKGEGNIGIDVSEGDPETRITIAFGSLDAFDIDGQTPLFSGDGLVVNARGTTGIIAVDDQIPRANYLGVSIPSVEVPDLRPYQRFLPDKWAVKLHGGAGELQGKAELSNTTFNARLELRSDDADVGVKDYRFHTNLDMGLTVDSPSLASGKVDVSGTYVKLDDARLSSDDDTAEPWHASINIDNGVVRLNLEKVEEGVSGVKDILRVFGENEFKSLLASADEELKIEGSISDLRWLNLLLENPYDFAISGSGEVSADVVVTSGWLEEGTHLTISPNELIVDVLDYQAKGGGGVELNVVKGGEFPDMTLDVALTDAQFSRKGDERAFIEDVDIELQAQAKNMRFDSTGRDLALRLLIPSAKIQDMAVYNPYLPEQFPLQILGGEASLVVDILLKPDDADGYVRLTTKDIRARVDDQDVTGELTADIKLIGGIPENMDFDISGSSLVLDGVRVAGEQEDFRDEDWAARLDLTRGRAVWRKPIRLDLEADVQMANSIPIVAIMANERGKHGWLEKALTIDDVSGEVSMQMANDQIVIPYAFASSDKIDVGAKGTIVDDSRNGVFYVRFRKLHGILKINDGERNIDILKARKKFDEYSTDAVMAKMVSE